MARPLIFLHGYSANADDFELWRSKLIAARGLNSNETFVIDYKTLANNVGINDIAEGFDRALKEEANLGELSEFDAVVHSTGMLVIRAWLARYNAMNRPERLRHLIALAPATNGSPVAHKGRSWIGALVKGSKNWRGPDFMESGDEVLKALELGSEFTWSLAERDLFGDGNTARFLKGPKSPFVFTFCGDSGLGAITDLATQAVGTKINGSDGVVRWAGAALNSRRLLIDYSLTDPSSKSNTPVFKVSEWTNQNNELVLWPGMNHGTIMDKHIDSILDLVVKAFDVESDDAYLKWNDEAQSAAASHRRRKKPRPWQQFVIRVSDERGVGVQDWSIGLSLKKVNESRTRVVPIDDLHPYGPDKSYRCLHLDLEAAGIAPDSDLDSIESFVMELSLSTSTPYVVYERPEDDTKDGNDNGLAGIGEGLTRIRERLDVFLKPDNKYNFILPMPFTTTFVEIRVNRSPSPAAEGRSLCHVKSVERNH
jgi:pimeloyl-ACP methyl ester carboxylesterase